MTFCQSFCQNGTVVIMWYNIGIMAYTEVEDMSDNSVRDRAVSPLDMCGVKYDEDNTPEAQQEAVRRYVEQVQPRLLASTLRRAAKNVELAAEMYPKIIDGSVEVDGSIKKAVLGQGFKGSLEILRSVGILPSQSTSIIYNQLNQVANIQIDTHVQALAGALSPVKESEAIEVDYTDIEDF